MTRKVKNGMILAVIGDVRSNFLAFEAVLDAVEAEGIHIIVQTGNLALGGDGGNSVIELLQERSVIPIQGTEDRQTVMYRKKAASFRKRLPESLCDAMAAAQEYLSSRNLEYLGELQRVKKLEMDGLSIVCTHGAPSTPSVILDGDTELSRFEREREVASPDLVICGGADTFFARQAGDTLFAGPGRLVNAAGEAGYMLVSTEERPWSAKWVVVA